MSDGTAERSLKRRRVDENPEGAFAPGVNATVGAIGWVVVHDTKHVIVFPPELPIADADKQLISRALSEITQYQYETQYLTRPVPGAVRPVSDKVKYNIQVCPPLPLTDRRLGGPCTQIEVQFPIGSVLPLFLFNNVAAIDPARIPMSEIKLVSRPERGPDNTMETILIALIRVYAFPQTQERIVHVYYNYASTHPPGAIPVAEPVASADTIGSWLRPFMPTRV